MFGWKFVACGLFLVFCFVITYLYLSGHDHQVKYHSSISLLFCLTFLALPVLYLLSVASLLSSYAFSFFIRPQFSEPLFPCTLTVL